MTNDEWSKVGVIGTLVGVVVGVLVGTRVPVVLRLLDRRLSFHVTVRGSGRQGPMRPTHPGAKVNPHHRWVVVAHVVKKGRSVVFLKNVRLANRRGNSAPQFLSKSESKVELAPFDDIEFSMDLGMPGKNPQDEEHDRKFIVELLGDICKDGSFFEVVTADNLAKRWWAAKVCDPSFLMWPGFVDEIYRKRAK